MKHHSLATISFSLLTLSMLGLAQPGQSRPDQSPSAERAAQQEQDDRKPPQGRLALELKLDPEALRIRLERSIARSQETIDRSQAALEKLDSGASASEVLRELRVASPDRQPRSGNRPERSPEQQEAGSGILSNEALLDFVRNELPELWKNLGPVIENEPRGAERLLGRMAPQIREILALQHTEPELAKLKAQQMRAGLNLVEAGNAYRRVLGNPDATQQEREAALAKIRSEAERRFDVELKGKQHEVDRLEARLAELRASVELIEAQRDREVELMVISTQRNAERLNRQQSQRHRPGSDSQSGDD